MCYSLKTDIKICFTMDMWTACLVAMEQKQKDYKVRVD